MEIVLIIIAFIGLLLFVVWLPFFKSATNNNVEQNLRNETNVELYKEHKIEIEKDFNDGAIDEENYQYLLAELDNSLLQDISEAEKEPDIILSNKQFSVLWPISLSVFIVAFSVVLYLKQGMLETLMATPVPNQESQQEQMLAAEGKTAQEQILAHIKKLQQHLQENPEDAEAWYNLGQTLVGSGEFDLAITAFEQVIRIEGEHADLLGVIAQASYYRNNQQIDEQVQSLIDRALALDINDPSTNILLGMHNFIGQEYEQAIEHWQRVIDANKPNVNIIAIQEAVVEAKSRLGINTNSATNEQAPSKATLGPQLKVNVSLSAEITEQLANEEDKVVFVYAIPTDGKRIPLAALKLMASDLPKIVTLSNSNAMSAQSNLSSVGSVHIYAIVSKQGGAGIKPGDFKAEVNDISVDNTETINLIVNELVE